MIETIRARDVAGLLDLAPPGIELLSLDCFDTLIWRNTHAPVDVFADLDVPGGGLQPRIWAEATVRRLARARDRRLEIELGDVYRRLYPAADEARIAELVAAELALEARHAFAFAPTVRLMEEAKRRGLRIVIVSDMYLTEDQLRAHIAGAAGPDVLAMIDAVFVSAAHGRGKCEGLFETMLKAMRVRPGAVLHLGDNRAADYDAARRHGLHAVHLQQFDTAAETRLRQEAAAAAIVDPAARATRAICQPHRAAVSLRRDDDPATALGHDVLGPVLHTFALWLKAELAEMRDRLGRPVRPLFLMRDGYLPLRVFEQVVPEVAAAPVEISRFAATRASLCEPDALDTYLADWLRELPIRTLSRQLMLFDREVERFARPMISERVVEEFNRFVCRPDTHRKIRERADAFTTKLEAHLARAGVQPGDAIMLVDIGYNGTVQNLVTHVLERRMGLTVAGRYLFLRESVVTGHDKKGLLDVSQHDCRILHGMSSNGALIEQLCNVAQGSTVDFKPDGTPIREEADEKVARNATRDAVQRACLDFVASAAAGAVRPAGSDDLQCRRQTAAAILARLFYLPNEAEIALLDDVHHDANMGTGTVTKLFDAQAARARMRSRGLMFLDEEARAFPSAELSGASLAASLTLFASSRFALDLRGADFAVGGIEVPVMLVTASEHVTTSATAYPTAEGFYRLCVPTGASRPTVAIQLGTLWEVVQVEAAEHGDLARHDKAGGSGRSTPATLLPDGCETLAPDLYRMTPAGFVAVLPPARKDAAMLSFVFRPIRARSETPALRVAS